MNDLIKSVLNQNDVGLGPSIAVVVFFLTMLAIIGWTFRPNAKKDYENQGDLTVK